MALPRGDLRAKLEVPSRFVLEFGDAISGISRVLRSSSEINWLIDGLCCKRPPAVDLTHVDLTRGEQRPEQHRRSICRWQYGLRFDPALELFVQTFDRVCCSRVRHWLRGRRVKVKRRSPASSRQSATGRWRSRHLRMKALRRVSISLGVAA